MKTCSATPRWSYPSTHPKSFGSLGKGDFRFGRKNGYPVYAHQRHMTVANAGWDVAVLDGQGRAIDYTGRDRPPIYEAPVLLRSSHDRPSWAEETLLEHSPQDGTVYQSAANHAVLDALPRNPVGRTGVAGRGLLGAYGPNHAADPIVTRWNGVSQCYEFVAVKRADTGEWAIPVGHPWGHG